MKNFALIGAAGYIAPRHIRAIRDTGNRLVAAVDPHDSVGILDTHFPEARFFSEIERFDRFLEKLRRQSEEERIHYVSICSPNYLHDAHVRLALRIRADAIREKPLVVSPWNLDALAELEQETGARVHSVLQLRLHPKLLTLKRSLESDQHRTKADVCLTYVTRRGPWYHVSWKGISEKSGGLPMNIGIHLFDLLLWLFGPLEKITLHTYSHERVAGVFEFVWARVRWLLSVDGRDVPAGGSPAHRSMQIDGHFIDFSDGFSDLHTELYRRTLAGEGFGIEDARPSINLVHALRQTEPEPSLHDAHPFLTR